MFLSCMEKSRKRTEQQDKRAKFRWVVKQMEEKTDIWYKRWYRHWGQG